MRAGYIGDISDELHLRGLRHLRYEVPISEALIDELFPFWASIFGEVLPDIAREVFLGAEDAYNGGTLYLQREGGRLASTCFTMQSKTLPGLAGFSEVATDPQLRGRGMATELCGRAVEAFRRAGGEAFFLGTVNPAAARVYRRLGWRKLAGANVMANILSGASPEAFLVDYFSGEGATVGEASPADRIPMIPLILCPHDWQVLDANTGVCSTRYATQNSCMGLYVRYGRVRSGGGTWFAARTAEGKVVGLATARRDEAGAFQIDAFAHARFADVWEELVQAAVGRSQERGEDGCYAVVSVEDEEKQSWFESLGFRRAGSGAEFALDGRRVASVRMEKSSA
ncbi:MAG: GNAT family N-acetyltransferase [Caldilineaceae bacterium SB0661_bin_32]|uniref:GNAT family N-acetyltransferase n=1 Tax=Caldilineaceae bacterium SB0661_bin_32 TaxID=2605255 RepID=A0A6B1DB03_9CHLR|nr:GNAT family N-acetyltransferase [Caldilineaceae bacterium SB0661_bin_32]